MNTAIHITLPTFTPRPRSLGGGGGRFGAPPPTDVVKEALAKINEIKTFFREAKAYLAEPAHKETNLKFEAVKRLFSKQQKLSLHRDQPKEMLASIIFIKKLAFHHPVVGVSRNLLIHALLTQHKITIVPH